MKNTLDLSFLEYDALLYDTRYISKEFKNIMFEKIKDLEVIDNRIGLSNFKIGESDYVQILQFCQAIFGRILKWVVVDINKTSNFYRYDRINQVSKVFENDGLYKMCADIEIIFEWNSFTQFNRNFQHE